MINKTRKIKGGKYLGEGTYGCVFGDPPLKCIDDKERSSEGVISKLLDFSAGIKEIEEAQKWNNVDPTQEFSLTPSKKCSLDKNNIRPENNFNKCKVSYRNEIEMRVLVFYKYGGPDLYKLLPKSANYEKIFSGFQTLFDGLVIAHANNLVHTDIKPPNILTGEKDIHLRFIDFGLSFDVSDRTVIDDPTSIMYTGNFFYPYWPLEFKCIDAQGNLKEFEYVKSHYDEFNRFHAFEISGLGLTRCKIPVNILYNIYKETDLKDVKTMFKKMDVFSMGITLMEEMRIYFSHHPIQQSDGSYILYYTDRVGERSEPYSTFTKLKEKDWLTEKQYNYQIYLYENVTTPLMNFISHCVDYNPKTRYPAQEAADEYRKLLPIFKKHLKQEQLRRGLQGLWIFNEANDLPLIPTPTSTSASASASVKSIKTIPRTIIEFAHKLFKKSLTNDKIVKIAHMLGSTLARNTAKDKFLSDIVRLLKEKYNLVLLI